MSRLPMLDNIFGQPQSHRALLAFHQSESSTLPACAARIREARGRVILSGMGASLFGAIPAAARLNSFGIAAEIIESAELLHYGSASLRQGDLGILISRSGASIEVLRLAERMRAAGMTVIGVTNLSGSELERIADHTLLIGSQADQLVAVQTYTGTVLALLLLAENAVVGDILSFADSFLDTLPLLASYIEECVERSESWSDFLNKAEPLYLIARGPALASAYEGALLMHETAKSAAVPISSGQFRHGPVEVVSPKFRAVVFGAPEPTRALDRALARDLLRMGADVRWIGPSDDASSSTDLSDSDGTSEAARDEVDLVPLAPWPPISLAFASLFDIVPLQCAAYRLALWRGVVPGDFRFASEITAAESGFPFFQARLER